MRYRSLMIMMLFLALGLTTMANDLDKVRANYKKVVSDKELCEKMIDQLEESKHSSAIHLAYLGGMQTIWANHVGSPLRKLDTFKIGKANIEKAIKKEPNNAELRFIRLSVQKNIPSFLGYKSKIDEDVAFLNKNLHQINSEVLKQNIKALLKE